MEDPMTLAVALRENAINRKKRPHRRSQSNDSASSKEGCSKTGKVGKVRKLQWSMKDLLSSTSLMTIDSASVGSGAEGTCATDTTGSIVSLPSSSQHPNSTRSSNSKIKGTSSGISYFLGANDSLVTMKPPQESNKENASGQLPILQNQLPHFGQKPPSSCTTESMMPLTASTKGGRRKLIPRLPRSFLGQLRQTTAFVPSSSCREMEITKNSPPGSPFTPSALAITDDSSSSATSLTPISPTRLCFDDFPSPCSSLSKDDGKDLNHAMMLASGENDPSNSTSLLSGEISIILFPEDTGVASPLTPSPKLNSPPIRRRERKPHPFVLERILSESICVPGGENKTSFANNDDTEKLPEESVIQPGTCEQHKALSLHVTLTETAQDHPSQSRKDHVKSRQSLDTTTSVRKLRSTIKSVPVDVDDVKFVEVEKNLHTLGEMADDFLERLEYDEALDVLKEILRGNLEKHGYEHESVGLTLHNIASVHMKQKNFNKAESSMLKAVDCRKLALGDDHPDVALSMVQLGLVYFEKEQYDEALDVFQKALRIRRLSLGPSHLKVAKVLNNIGCTLKHLHINMEAIMAFEEGLELQKEALASMSAAEVCGEAFSQLSLSTASTLSNISTVKLSLGLIDEALVALDEAYKIQSSILAADHSEVKETKKGIDYICKTRTRRDLTEAIELADPEVNDQTALIPAMLAYCQPTEQVLRGMEVSPPARFHLRPTSGW